MPYTTGSIIADGTNTFSHDQLLNQLIMFLTTQLSTDNWTLNKDTLDQGDITLYVANGGATTVTSIGHGLLTGAAIAIAGSTSYDGFHTISNVTTDTFDIPVTFVADEANSRWFENEASGGTLADREVYLSGPGDGTPVYINIRRFNIDPVPSAYNWEVRGAINYSASDTFENQPGVSGDQYFVIYDANLNYRFYANGRRFIIGAQLPEIQTNMYAGFYLPYATPSELPYPIVIMCNSGLETQSFSDVENTTHFFGFFRPYCATITGGILVGTTSLRRYDGFWTRFQNNLTYNSTSIQSSSEFTRALLWPYTACGYINTIDANNDLVNVGAYGGWIKGDTGNIVLLPTIIGVRNTNNVNGQISWQSHESIEFNNEDAANENYAESYGELDGVYWIPGQTFSALNDLITYSDPPNPDRYFRAFQDLARGTLNSFCAIEEI
jgi:hypothetical protein